MAISKNGNRWVTPLLFVAILAVLITLVSLPILPDPTACGGRVSYASMLRDVWNEKISKRPTVATDDCDQ